MKNFLVYIFLTLGVFVLFSSHVLAQVDIGAEIGSQLGAAGTEAGFDVVPTDPRVTVANVIKVILSLIATIFLALTIYAGFLWMTAAGNDDKITKAKSLLFQAVIGLIIILAAYAITAFAIRIATGSGTTDTNGVTQYIGPTGLTPTCEGIGCP